MIPSSLLLLLSLSLLLLLLIQELRFLWQSTLEKSALYAMGFECKLYNMAKIAVKYCQKQLLSGLRHKGDHQTKVYVGIKLQGSDLLGFKVFVDYFGPSVK